MYMRSRVLNVFSDYTWLMGTQCSNDIGIFRVFERSAQTCMHIGSFFSEHLLPCARTARALVTLRVRLSLPRTQPELHRTFPIRGHCSHMRVEPVYYVLSQITHEPSTVWQNKLNVCAHRRLKPAWASTKSDQRLKEV